MKFISNISNRISLVLRILGGAALTGMMLVTVADVTGRFFKHPIFGSVEIVGFMAVIVAAAALPHTYKVNGHVGVELFVRLLPARARLWMDLATRTLSLFLFGIIAWQMFLYAGDIKAAGEVSMNLEYPVHHIVYLLAAGLWIFSGTIIQEIIKTIQQIKESKI